ncbi:hypothetical protein DEAC_c42020 [Desulfosporosinus acididurans]|uniref:Uncharacterized protein n=1 Tax=Desulfosporosinus acididurans TaxID=476652 RepID=A0A0J1FKA1_9FIRM|nr:hypothetical protein [Desulfosporosinus acididurans]KLU63890.1 hypothetical protein DEAC_c42020 [Desulfosporosinus acididurans]
MDEELRKTLVQLIAGQEALISGQEELRAMQKSLITGQAELRAGQRGLIIGQVELNMRLSKLEVKFENMDNRLKKMVQIQKAHYGEDQRQHNEMIKLLSKRLGYLK